MFLRRLLALTLLLILGPLTHAVDGPRQYLKKPAAWFLTDDARRIATNILSYQSDLGGWPKNTDTTAAPYTGDRAKLQPTFDNSATTDELRFLAQIFNATHEAKYDEAFRKGYDYILKAQYPTGGWPQYYPPPKSYHRHITFNDDSMVRLMLFLRETYAARDYAFIDEARKAAARAAFERGVECIVKCQVKVDGKLTAWCAQHDETDYSPRPARTFELATLSGSESVGITRLLMSLDHPKPEVIQSVNAAVAWLESAKLVGIKVVQQPDKAAPKGMNKIVVQDPAAPPMWARFYDIASNKPIFSDRDGVAKANLADIGYERRNGYAWLGYWPQALLEKEYPAWRAKWPPLPPG
jgi:PelA/Pel-15E family pectate lyase